MTERAFGQTNLLLPPVWLSLRVPPRAEDGWLTTLVEAGLASGAPLDVSSSPGLWGGAMRGTNAILMATGSRDLARAADEEHAANLVRAHLIESLCAIGREYLDFYCLRADDLLRDFQIAGARLALDEARQEGHVRFVGLYASGEPAVAESLWRRLGAFDALVLSAERDFETLVALAEERRAGILFCAPDGEMPRANPERSWLIPVCTPEEVRAAFATGAAR